MAKYGICDFCGEDNKVVESTTMTGMYCAECHRIVIEESREALRRIKQCKAMDKYCYKEKVK